MTQKISADCRHFRALAPCAPHKQSGVRCRCPQYEKTGRRYLIIKLGAIGDVIRTTPLLRKIKSVHPDAEIWWLTNTPELLPDEVDRKLNFSLASVLQIEETRFDFVFSLDKDFEACALANRVRAKVKRGFILKGGKAAPADKAAFHKYFTGLFDDANKANVKSYPQEIFEICGWKFSGEKYLLPDFSQDGYEWDLKLLRPLAGLNTGCGGRWTSRLLPEQTWIDAARGLRRAGFGVLLLGGEAEHKRNLLIAKESGALYPGYFPLRQFINLVAQTDMVVTGVTMALHIAAGLGKKIVLLNNIFNPREFELYGSGAIVEPDKECRCYFSPKCKNSEYFCLDHLPAEKIVAAARKLMPVKTA
ncbi:MAG: glycosyltransferase family 9 protein [Elusimicrobiales bacterium]